VSAPAPTMYDCQGALDDARSMLEDLGQEMRDWYDNMPESFQNTDKGERVDEAANTLEEAVSELEDAPECASAIPKFPVVDLTKKRASRAARCGHATSILQSIIDAVNEYTQHQQNPPDPVIVEELLSWVETLDACKDRADEVEFPGMYG
jgi:hypothetical protein